MPTTVIQINWFIIVLVFVSILWLDDCIVIGTLDKIYVTIRNSLR